MNVIQPVLRKLKLLPVAILAVWCLHGCVTEWDKRVGKASYDEILKEKVTPPWKDELKPDGERKVVWREGPYVQHNMGKYSGHETVSYFYQTFVFDKQGFLKNHEGGFRNSQ